MTPYRWTCLISELSICFTIRNVLTLRISSIPLEMSYHYKNCLSLTLEDLRGKQPTQGRHTDLRDLLYLHPSELHMNIQPPCNCTFIGKCAWCLCPNPCWIQRPFICICISIFGMTYAKIIHCYESRTHFQGKLCQWQFVFIEMISPR